MPTQLHQVADDLSPNTAARARITTQRADRLREFILGHLPEDVSVDVVISSNVRTAAVLPVDVEAIVSSDTTDIQRAQAEQFLAGVDADYLVLVTGNEADLTRIPLNDQLTADHAHQFGLSFHELLHILKTAIGTIGQLIEEEIDEEYHEQVHDLINIIEDGAIESEAIHGDNFSDNAGIRLELTRRIHSNTPEDIPDGEEVYYSFLDGVTSCLYDEAIYPTGTTEVLLDESDSRIQFKSEADRAAFEQIHAELCNIASDALDIRSADRSDTTHTHDKTASVRRARRVIQTWKEHIQPILESGDNETERGEQEGQDDGSQRSENGDDPSPPQPGNSEGNRSGEDTERSEPASHPHDGGDISNRNRGPEENTQNSPSNAAPTDEPDDFDPEDVSLSREATENSSQNIFEQPQITADPDLDEVDETESGDSRDSDDTDGFEDISESDASQEVGSEEPAEFKADTESDSDSETDSEPANRAEAIAQAADRARDREQDKQEEPPQSAVSSSINNERRDEQNRNPTLGDFSGQTGDEAESHGCNDGDSSESEPGAENDERGEQGEETGDATQTEAKPESEGPEGPAHAESANRAPEEEKAAYEDALAGDERTAHDEADREGIDQQALEEELSALADQLERGDSGQVQSDQSEENGDQSGGSLGGPGSLDDLNILPISGDVAPRREWSDIEDGADQVAETLEMYLRLDRRKSVRRGLSAGAYDTRAGHRLSIGDPRVCKSQTLGNEKQYALVLILDRSSSMRRGSPPKIEIATQALARFALAAENLGIRVAIIDFINGEARLVKPFSVETRHVQATLLDKSYGGGTPLSDAIGLAREVVEAQRDEPMIITVTDDRPSSTDDVIEQIRRSHAPVCSLTVATDCEPGSLAQSASELARYYERQEAVYTPERLKERLDQFASLLGGL